MHNIHPSFSPPVEQAPCSSLGNRAWPVYLISSPRCFPPVYRMHVPGPMYPSLPLLFPFSCHTHPRFLYCPTPALSTLAGTANIPYIHNSTYVALVWPTHCMPVLPVHLIHLSQLYQERLALHCGACLCSNKSSLTGQTRHLPSEPLLFACIPVGATPSSIPLGPCLDEDDSPSLL